MALDKIIPRLYVSDYETLEKMPEDNRKEFMKIAVLWPWEIGDPMEIESRYQKYQKKPRQAPLSDVNIVFSDPEAMSVNYLDMEKLDAVAFAIHHNLEAGKKVLVYCSRGHERSPTAVIRYLQLYRGLSLRGAEKLVRGQHPETRPVEQWMKKMAPQ